MNVFFHIVWATKNRIPLLHSTDLRAKVWEHIKENAKNKNIKIDVISGYSDHCHCLISLTPSQILGTVVQLLKGESSHWINKNKLCHSKFGWQEHYYSIRVTQSELDKIRKHIEGQEEHHRKLSFAEELTESGLKI